MITRELEAEAVEVLERIATREGVPVVSLLIRACGPLLGVDVQTLERMREVELAADLEPGSLLDSLACGFETYAFSADALLAWLQSGWDLEMQEDEVRARLGELVVSWEKGSQL